MLKPRSRFELSEKLKAPVSSGRIFLLPAPSFNIATRLKRHPNPSAASLGSLGQGLGCVRLAHYAMIDIVSLDGLSELYFLPTVSACSRVATGP